MARFSEVLTIVNGKNQKQVENPNGKYPIYGSGGIMGYADDYICDGETVIIGRKGSINKPIFVDGPFWNVDTAFGLCAKKEVLLPKYLYYFCEKFDFEQLNTTVTIPSLTKANLLNIEIKLPSLVEQTRIVTLLDKIAGLTSLRKQQLAKLDELVKARFVEMFGDPSETNTKWILSSFGEQFSITSGGTPSTARPEFWNDGRIPWIGSNMCQNSVLYKNDGKFITELGLEQSSAKMFEAGTVLVALVGATIGKTALLRFPTATNQNIAAIDVVSNEQFIPEFIFYVVQFLYCKFQEIGNGKFKMANQNFIKSLPLICPPLALQKNFSSFAQQIEWERLTIQQGRDKLEALRKLLMQKYFG